MHTLTIQSNNLENFNKILWLLEHFEGDGINIIQEEDYNDLQLIQQARKERDAVSLDNFLASVQNEN